MPTGLFVVGSRAADLRNLMTANWVMQVATAPKLVVVSVESGAVTRRLIDEGGAFSVSVLARSDAAVTRRFVKPVDAMEVDEHGEAISSKGVPVHEVGRGLPCLSSAVSWLVCEVRHRVGGGVDPEGRPASHVLYVGEVTDVGTREDLAAAEDAAVLRMEDTRMHYGG